MATGRRRGRAIIYIALLLILLLVLAFAVLRFYPIGGVAPTGEVAEGTVVAATPTLIQDVENIVVTTQDVRRGQVLSEDLLAVVAISREQYTEGIFFKDVTELVGSRAKFDLKARTPLTDALVILPGSTGSIMSFEIPAGKVAISIPISKLSSVSYGLQKGDRVNVIVALLLSDLDINSQSRLPNRTGVVIGAGPTTPEDQINVTAIFQSPPGYEVSSGQAYSYYGRVEVDPATGQPVYLLPSEQQRPRMVSQTLIQDVMVLQMGTYTKEEEAPVEPVATPEAGAVEEPVEEEATVPEALPDVITLVVNPQDAVSINYLMLSGASLNLVMRSAGDSSQFDTESATLQFILDQYRIPNPAKLPYGLEPGISKFPSTVAPFPDAGISEAPVPTE